jgi:DNA-binding MarR family transcriptional regulator
LICITSSKGFYPQIVTDGLGISVFILTYGDEYDILTKKVSRATVVRATKGEDMWHFGAKVNKLSRSMGAYRTSRLDEKDLLPHHHSLVLAVCREEGRSQERLAEKLCLNKSTIARSLALLEEKGYVRRIPSQEDRRVLLVYPTEKMCALYPKIRQVTDEWNAKVTEGISEEELAVCASVLKRMQEKAVCLLREEKE